MEISAALAADLAILAEAVGEDAANIASNLSQLITNARLAVSSYLGLSLTVEDGEHTLSITVLEDRIARREAISSVSVPLPAPGRPRSGAALVLYADRPGAFIDLAADLAWLTGYPLDEFVFDRHLDIPSATSTDGLVASMSQINQAIGVLIGRGYSIEQARSEISRRAAGTGREAAAAHILDSIGQAGLDSES